MNERKISLGPTIAQQDRAHARLRRASSERGAGPQGIVGNTLSLGNTLCPKIGAAQWTCTKDECTCHLKDSIGRRQRATLADEIDEARARLAALEHRALSATCAEIGHKMECTGGSNCGCEDGSCSIPVNTCKRCGDCDYGDNDEARDVIARCHT